MPLKMQFSTIFSLSKCANLIQRVGIHGKNMGIRWINSTVCFIHEKTCGLKRVQAEVIRICALFIVTSHLIIFYKQQWMLSLHKPLHSLSVLPVHERKLKPFNIQSYLLHSNTAAVQHIVGLNPWSRWSCFRENSPNSAKVQLVEKVNVVSKSHKFLIFLIILTKKVSFGM